MSDVRRERRKMKDLPCILMAATVWAYWACVGAMIVRVRRRTRKLSGIVPSQRLEQLMWIVWVPLVAAWMLLPYRGGRLDRARPGSCRPLPARCRCWCCAGRPRRWAWPAWA